MTSDHVLNLLIELIAHKFSYLRIDIAKLLDGNKISSPVKKIVADDGLPKVCAVVYILDTEDFILMHHLKDNEFSLKLCSTEGHVDYKAVRNAPTKWEVTVLTK